MVYNKKLSISKDSCRRFCLHILWVFSKGQLPLESFESSYYKADCNTPGFEYPNNIVVLRSEEATSVPGNLTNHSSLRGSNETPHDSPLSPDQLLTCNRCAVAKSSYIQILPHFPEDNGKGYHLQFANSLMKQYFHWF